MRLYFPATIAGGLALALPAALFLSLKPGPGGDAAFQGQAPRNRFVGVAVCETCHKAKEKGEQFQKWQAGPHSKAYATLATPKAKEIAAKLEIKDPQKEPKCLKCHTTAFGVDPKLIRKGFKPEEGVQCESCHGPGELHRQKRFAIAAEGEVDLTKAQEVPVDEITSRTPVAVCLQCHNPESPTFKPFCFRTRYFDFLHLDPRKKRDPKWLEELKCPEGEKCKSKQAECGGYPPYKKEGADNKKEGGEAEKKG